MRATYLSVYHMHAWCLQRPEGHWVSWNWSNRWFWKQSLIVLKEQQVLLMAEPSFQPYLHPLKLFLSGILTTRMRKVTAIKFWEFFFYIVMETEIDVIIKLEFWVLKTLTQDMLWNVCLAVKMCCTCLIMLLLTVLLFYLVCLKQLIGLIKRWTTNSEGIGMGGTFRQGE